MAEDKKSFVLYCDLLHTIRKLSDENAGKLFKHVLEYVNDNDPKPESELIDIVFEPIRQSLKRDLERYRKTVERNRLNGAKGGRPKKPNETEKTQSVISKPKKADSDNDNDNVNDIIKSPKVDFDFDKFLTFINTTLGKKHTVINQAVRKSIKARLKEGYTKESFMNAVLNLKEVQTHRENNYTYCTPEFISRSATLDKYGQRHEVTPEDRLSQLKKERGWE